MTRDEMVDLLTIAASYDKRKVGEADVWAWGDAAQRCRWTFDEAAEAIKMYYATSVAERPFVMPSHVTNWIKGERQDRALRHEAERLTEPPAPVSRAIEPLAEATRMPKPHRQPALRVQCPHCGAQPGDSCTRVGLLGRRHQVKPHPSRVAQGEAQAS